MTGVSMQGQLSLADVLEVTELAPEEPQLQHLAVRLPVSPSQVGGHGPRSLDQGAEPAGEVVTHVAVLGLPVLQHLALLQCAKFAVFANILALAVDQGHVGFQIYFVSAIGLTKIASYQVLFWFA